MKELKVGTRVKLRADSRYRPTPSNPTMGTKFECVGSVTKLNIGGSVYVSWDNGTSNDYSGKNDLTFAEGCRDIWIEKWH